MPTYGPTFGEGAPSAVLYRMQGTAAGDTIANDSQGQVFASSVVTVPAGTLLPGSVMFVRARGILSTDSAATTMLTELGFAGSVLATSTPLQSPNIVDRGWQVDAEFVCISPTMFEAQGRRIVSSAARTSVTEDMPSTSPYTFNPMQANTLNLAQLWGASATANSITLRQFTVSVFGQTP